MQLMTIKEGMSYVRKSKSAFYRDIENGVIPVIHIGSKPLVVKDKLDAMIRRQLRRA